MKRIALIDIDSVLIEPLGYRKAVVAVWDYIINLMQIPPIPLSEQMLANMEAFGITSEWDMLPIMIASLWQTILSQTDSFPIPADGDVLSAAQAFAKAQNIPPISEIPIPKIKPVPNQFPAETALEAGYFPAIPKTLADNLLRNSRDPYLSATTRLFQQFVLGSEKFQQTYRLPAIVQSPSFLTLYDRPLIPDDIRTALLTAQQNGMLDIAIITSRPSLPPHEVVNDGYGYAPEAEIALESLGMANMALIGFGKLKYISNLYQLKPDELIKPAGAHSLAAILALLMGDEKLALHMTINWAVKRNFNSFYEILPQHLEIHLIEDTLSGVRSAQTAVQLLRQLGRDVRLYCYGLTGSNQAKSAAFENENIPHFGNWQQLWQVLAENLTASEHLRKKISS